MAFRRTHNLPGDLRIEFVDTSGNALSLEEKDTSPGEFLCLDVRDFSGQIVIRHNHVDSGSDNGNEAIKASTARSVDSTNWSDFDSAEDFPERDVELGNRKAQPGGGTGQTRDTDPEDPDNDHHIEKEAVLTPAVGNSLEIQTDPLSSAYFDSSQGLPLSKLEAGLIAAPKVEVVHDEGTGSVAKSEATGRAQSAPPQKAVAQQVESHETCEKEHAGQEQPAASSSSLSRSSIARTRSLRSNGVLPMLVQMKVIIPKHIRQKRELKRKQFSESGSKWKTIKSAVTKPGNAVSERLSGAPTRLHELCAEADVTLEALEQELALHPEACSILDGKERTPLHVIADNDALFYDKEGKQVVATFVLHLIKAYPEAITMVDSAGRMPFVSLLEDWCKWVYEKHEEETKRRRRWNQPGQGSRSPNAVIGRVAEQINDQVETLWTGSQDSSDCQDPALGLANLALHSKASRLYPRAEVWEEAEFCLEMLSLIMDELGGKNGGVYPPDGSFGSRVNSRDKQALSELASHVVQAVPTLFKTILLIESDGGYVRRQLLNTTVLRRLLLQKESVGQWFTQMLRRKGVPALRAVDFMILVSKSTPEDYAGQYRSILKEDLDDFDEAKEKVFEAMQNLRSTIASLVVLDDRDVDRAVSCNVVWYLLSRNLLRPFVVGLFLVDFSLHITLMLAVREDVFPRTESLGNQLGNVPNRVVVVICFFFLIRKVLEALALFQISLSVFRSYITNVWTVLDIVTIAMTIAAVSYTEANPGDYRNGYNALTIGLLWIRVLGFLKVSNKYMATFIMAVAQILKDLRYFGIVLLVIVFMFGDMFSIAVSTKDNGLFCENIDEDAEGTLIDFCTPGGAKSYLRVYALLLGDFELDNYKETQGMIVLFFLFTVGGVIILLNVLIALTSDSYERANTKSDHLFGRARVLFVSQNEALEAFLRPGTDIMVGNSAVSKATSSFLYICRWAVLVTMLGTTISAEVFLCTRAWAASTESDVWAYVVSSIFLALLLSIGLYIMFVFALEDIIGSLAPGFLVRVFRIFCGCSQWIAKTFSGRIFGEQLIVYSKRTSDNIEGETEEWTGRVNYMVLTMEKKLEENRKMLVKEIKSLEKRLEER